MKKEDFTVLHPGILWQAHMVFGPFSQICSQKQNAENQYSAVYFAHKFWPNHQQLSDGATHAAAVSKERCVCVCVRACVRVTYLKKDMHETLVHSESFPQLDLQEVGDQINACKTNRQAAGDVQVYPKMSSVP